MRQFGNHFAKVFLLTVADLLKMFRIVVLNKRFELQKAQLLLGWPTDGAKSIYLEVNAMQLN